MVQRRDKGKHIVSDVQPQPRGQLHTNKTSHDGNKFAALHLVNGIDEPASLAETLKAIPIGPSPPCQPSYDPACSRSSPIPYVYAFEANDHQEECPRVPLDEEVQEIADLSNNVQEVEVEAVYPTTMSARQRKKEAKIRFSGTRPKGRHRP